MDTSKPAIFVNGALLPMHVRKRVRTVIQVVGADRGAVVGKSPDDLQLVVKGSPPSAPLTNFVEVIGIADSEKSIQAEIWTNFGDAFGMAYCFFVKFLSIVLPFLKYIGFCCFYLRGLSGPIEQTQIIFSSTYRLSLNH